MSRVLTSAEPFGFGPVSKMRSVTAALADIGWEADFVGSGTALTYATGEDGVFRRILPLDRPGDLARVPADGYDLALSVMDPFLSVWAASNGVPCVYVDSLFWMWDWDDADDVRERWDALMSDSPSLTASLDQLALFSMPAAEYVGHRLATVSCVQRTPSTSRAAAARADITPVVETGGIVDRSRRTAAPRDAWLVCMSGLRNPLIDSADAGRWATAALHLVDDALAESGMAAGTVHLTGNADVLGPMRELPDGFHFVPRPAAAVLDLMNSAQACLTPPGLTTMLESLAYGCPIVPLPPQHYAHDRILGEFSDHDADAFRQSVPARTLVSRPTGDAAVDTTELIRSLERMAAHRGPEWDRAVRALAHELCRVVRSRDVVLGQQRTVTSRFLGGFDGVAEVVEVVDALHRDGAVRPVPATPVGADSGPTGPRPERGEQDVGDVRP